MAKRMKSYETGFAATVCGRYHLIAAQYIPEGRAAALGKALVIAIKCGPVVFAAAATRVVKNSP